MFDAIVVGARVAGSATALMLARTGHRVLVLDRATFPSDTLSTHLIHQPGVAALARWGLLDELRRTGCPPLDHVVYEVAGIRVEGCGRGVEGQRAAYAPRRHVLDHLMLEAAARAGAEIRQGCRVTALTYDDTGRVNGVEGTHAGKAFRAASRLVIGADGMRSTVAELVRAPFTAQHPRLTCAYYSYWQDLPASLELHEAPARWVAAVATHDATLVLTYFPQSRFDEVRADAERHHLRQVRETAPELYERLQSATRVERLRGTGDQQNYFRQASGPGWALVGDAGHHKDSITARGISDAYLQAELLVRHVQGRLDADPALLDQALTGYGEERDAALLPGYEATLAVGRLDEQHPQRLALLRAIRKDPELTSIYFDMVAGAATIGDLYTPKLLALL
ncbi:MULTISPECIES: FAD-dependent oxidoreductase [unclassified Streptomyces]|uniref:FAD-dependent oxidoreductase n=1 Tax=unclassified Streptomyces TaxID=2593676 RepID=UPI001660B5F3|nr:MULTISPECIES: NAD(P)/FAD-dependent oxidoreductase [unclassified Streptomyces]MBD0710872.1 FAD-dependent oxidoreductase [Streptomyces sp. CBMA291]MBD0717837.1 FAD-dependent oxidoreductase [Streptomyces sp. CBMA370]